MRYFLTLVALSIPVFVPAAPRLAPRPTVAPTEAEAYRALVGPREVAITEMRVGFVVEGRKGTTYSVELHLEANGTGEKAQWVRTATVTIPGDRDDGQGTATGEFRIRARSLDDDESPTHPSLPQALVDQGWGFLLVLKQGDQFVAVYGPGHAWHVAKDIRVPE